MSEEVKEILDFIDDRIIPNEKWKQIRDYTVDLIIENQQLKEQLKDENNYHEEAVKWYKEAFEIEQERIKYKHVLDEIREYIEHEWFKRGQLGIVDKSFQEWQLRDILQILDKVKE